MYPGRKGTVEIVGSSSHPGDQGGRRPSPSFPASPSPSVATGFRAYGMLPPAFIPWSILPRKTLTDTPRGRFY